MRWQSKPLGGEGYPPPPPIRANDSRPACRSNAARGVSCILRVSLGQLLDPGQS
nr:MAG TPA: hypothetical protein [Caudoviricetes sp.]